MTLERVTLKARTVAVMVKVSVEMIEDVAGLSNIIGRALAASLGTALGLALLRVDGVHHPLGVRNQPNAGLTSLGVGNGAALTMDNLSEAVGRVWIANGAPTGITWSARTAGVADRWKHGNGIPLVWYPSLAQLPIFPTDQVPTNLTVGGAHTCSEVYVGDWSQLVVGTRTALTIDVSRVGADSTGGAMTSGQVWRRLYLRADAMLRQPKHFDVTLGVTS